MGIKDRVVRWAALRWLKGKMDRIRSEGGAVSKLFEGNQVYITRVIYFAAMLYALFTGGDVGGLVDSAIKALGMDKPGFHEMALIAIVAQTAFGLYGMYKATRTKIAQWKAGATLAEIGSPEGFAKLAAAQGVARTLDGGPIVVAGSAVVAKEAR